MPTIPVSTPPVEISVELESLLLDGSPRHNGTDVEHARMLAETDAVLPPILIQKGTMRVLDGVHRVHAAKLRGESRIKVILFEGDDDAAFVKAVEANVSHGLPLSLSDRRAAAERIVAAYPAWSNRLIAASTGLSARAVRAIRTRSTGASAHLNARVGKDGKLRPIDGAEGRRRAAEMVAKRPAASLREIARSAGVSLATAQDVRQRVRSGEDPVPSGLRQPGRLPERGANGVVASRGPAHQAGRPASGSAKRAPSSVLNTLMEDPSLRFSDTGRKLLRWLGTRVVEVDDWAGLADSVPPHCLFSLVELATGCAESWMRLSGELKARVRAMDAAGEPPR